ncbi:MAG: peptide deformylase [Candidatus Nomurabacteria bacterium]|nr:peptide deformylase [Candidatus Nomurabacteria bacterium]
MKQPIIQEPHPTLRTVAHEIPVDEITSDTAQTVIQDLFDTLVHESDGVAISAPQIDQSVRIFVVSTRAYNQKDTDDLPTVFINPVITHVSKKTEKGEEGCLSIRWVYGNVERPTDVTVTAYDETGETFTVEASGFVARVLQHEIDHLDGILFTDKATNIKKLSDEEAVEYQKKSQEGM